MRILALALERYGPFTDRTVRFREDARLHVVLGANEAGKSSALAAVTDLLFGIEERTRYAFRHDMPALRLGAEIRAADGRTLRFRRRKGRKNTLVDAGDAGLPDDSLAPFLGGLSREVFCRAFGLDSGSLRAGAAEMLDADGELGASLFAAASGLRGYRALQGRLEEEAAGIFMPRAARERTFYQALGRYEEARKAIRQGELRAGDWRDLNEEIAEAGTRLDAINAERRRIAGEQARLARLKRVAPLILAVDAAAEAAARDEGPDRSDPWTDALGARIAAEAAAREAAARVAEALERAEQDLAALPLDEGLLDRAEAVLEAFRGIARHDKDAQDLPRIRAEADGLAQNLVGLAARIGLPDIAALKLRQPSDAARTRVEGLVREGRALAAEIGRLTREDAAWGAGRAADRALAGPAEPLRDPAPLRADLRSFAGLAADTLRRDEIGRTVRQEDALHRLQAGRLDPPVPDLAALARTPLPSGEAIARHRRLFAELERCRERAADRHAAAARAAAETRLRLSLREGAGPLPSAGDLARLRAARDALLDALPAADLGSGADLQGCREAVAAADRMADDLLRDAARAAEQAADRIRLEAETEEARSADRTLAEIRAAQMDTEAAWQEAWAPTGIAPAPPAEMASWLGEVQTLLDGLASVETQRVAHRAIAERIEAARAPLAALAGRAGLDPLPGLDPALVLARIEERVAALGEAWERAREAEGRARAAAEQAVRRAADLAEARARETVWREAWTRALPAVGLDDAAGPDEAESALAAWAAVPAALAALEHQQRRIAGLGRDMEAYRTGADALVAALGPDLAGLPPTAAMKALHDRLREALERRARRTDLARRRGEAAEALAAAEAARGLACAALAEHLGDHPDDPAALHARLTARRALRLDLESRRADLARISDGVAEAELRADLAGTSPDAIEAALRGLTLEEEALDQRGKAAFADRDRAERRREALEGGTGAELALAQRKAAEAELAGEARRWAVLRLAGLLLGTAIGRQRAGQQDPLLTRAGALFSGLTGGAFAGLAQDYDAGDEPRLTGRRASGELVPVDGLSEGTRDQLYLALRLAYLEDYAARAEPAPFIGDDLFLTFDDARTAHGLEALAAIGAQVQPILFTHHRHVADLARSRLGEAVDVLEL